MIATTAVVHPSVQMGDNVTIWHFTTICADVHIGNNVVIGSNVFIGAGSILGDNVRIQHGVFLPKSSVVEPDVFIGPNATFTDDKYPRVGNALYNAEPPVIRRGSAVGAGTVVLPGVKIGPFALIGAGATVTRDVAENVTLVGYPAETIQDQMAWRIIKDKIVRMFEGMLKEWVR